MERVDSSVYPSDSASQVQNIQERDKRYQQSFNEKEDREYEEEINQETQAEIATRLRDCVVKYMSTCDKLKKLLAATRDLRKERKVWNEI